METVINVNGMMCPHCKAMVEKVCKAVPGTVDAVVDLHAKNVTVTGDADVAALKKAIVDAGYEVVDLGMDVEPEDIVEAVQDDPEVKIVGLSAMLTTTMYAMKETIEALEEAGLRDQVKVMVGGAPVNETFAKQINADGYSANAPLAVDLANNLMA